MLTATERAKLARVLAVINRKGGVGKTSIAANVGGIVAASGKRVLILDLDSQGNLGEDLGYIDTDVDDHGRMLRDAITEGDPLRPVEIRPNLDVVPGGTAVATAASYLLTSGAANPDAATRLAKAIADVADDYQLILLDCPPGENAIQLQALRTARWLMIPTQPDTASLQGLAHVAHLIRGVRPDNPTLELLGVVLFPVPVNATAIKAQARATLQTIVGEAAPVFNSVIRQAQAAAVQARTRGQLVFELARDAEAQDPFEFKKALDSSTGKRLAGSASPLAGDYVELTMELLTTLAAREVEGAK